MSIKKSMIQKVVSRTLFTVEKTPDALTGIVVVDNNSRKIEINAENRSEKWCSLFSKTAGFESYHKLWASKSSWANDGACLIAFSGPMFNNNTKNSLGEFVFVVKGGEYGYTVEQFSYGAGVNIDVVPSSIKRAKDLLPLIAGEIPLWIEREIFFNIEGIDCIDVTRKKGRFTVEIDFKATDGVVEKGKLEKVNAMLGNFDFKGVSNYPPVTKDRNTISVKFVCNHNLKLLKY